MLALIFTYVPAPRSDLQPYPTHPQWRIHWSLQSGEPRYSRLPILLLNCAAKPPICRYLENNKITSIDTSPFSGLNELTELSSDPCSSLTQTSPPSRKIPQLQLPPISSKHPVHWSQLTEISFPLSHIPHSFSSHTLTSSPSHSATTSSPRSHLTHSLVSVH